jgi:hypothetical protein
MLNSQVSSAQSHHDQSNACRPSQGETAVLKRIKSRLHDARVQTDGAIYDEQIIHIVQEEIQHYYELMLLD